MMSREVAARLAFNEHLAEHGCRLPALRYEAPAVVGLRACLLREEIGK